MKKPLQLLAGFSGSAMIAGLSSILTIPLLVSALGAEQWAHVAAAQSLGTILAVLVQLGWGATGTAEVATLEHNRQFEFYSRSVLYRTIVFLLCTLGVGAWVLICAENGTTPSLEPLVVIGFAGTGLSANWFFVGTKRAVAMLKFDALPRALLTVLGSVGSLLTNTSLPYATGIVLAAIVPFLLSSVVIARNYESEVSSYLQKPRVQDRGPLVGQLPGLATAIIATTYKQLPLLLLIGIAPNAAAPFALVDRIFKFAMAGLRPISQLLQATIPSTDYQTTALRAKSKIPTMLALSAAVALAYGLFTFIFGELLGTGTIELTVGIVAASAVALFMAFTTQWLGMGALVALEGKTMLMVSVMIGAGVSTAIVLPMIWEFQSLGAALSIAAAETTIFCIQLASVLGRCRVPRQQSPE